MREVSVILVSYNTRELTRRALAALQPALANIDHEIVVVDNASTDGSPAMIRDAFPAVRVVESPRNLGFGAANNVGMVATTGEFMLLVNTDAFVEPDAVARMLARLRADASAAIVGPRTLNADGTLQRSVFPFPSPTHAILENLGLSRPLARLGLRENFERWPHDAPRDVPWVIGACLLARRSAYEAVGGFDERFFMYSEETDWQRRIRAAGLRIVFEPTARVTHLGGASGASDRPKVNDAFFASLDRYVLKHHGRLGLLAFRGAMVVGCGARSLLWRSIGRLRGGDGRGRAAFHWWLARRQARLADVFRAAGRAEVAGA